MDTIAPTPVLDYDVLLDLPSEIAPEWRRNLMRETEDKLIRAGAKATGWPPPIVRSCYRIAWETPPTEMQDRTLMRALLLTQMQFAERQRAEREC